MAGKVQKGTVTLNDVQVIINGNVIGFIQDVKISIKRDMETLYQAGGEGEPVAFVQTKKEYTGSFDRTLVDVDIISQLMPNSGFWPEFELKGIVKSGLDVGESKNFVAHNCLCEGWDVDYSLDNAASQSTSFRFKRHTWL